VPMARGDGHSKTQYGSRCKWGKRCRHVMAVASKQASRQAGKEAATAARWAERPLHTAP
jgi:hypothetical protein